MHREIKIKHFPIKEGVSEAWCFKKLFELFDSIIIYGYVYSFWYKMMAL